MKKIIAAIKTRRTRRRILKFLETKKGKIEINNATPLDGDSESWEIHQRRVAFLGDPFRFNIGFLRFEIDQLSKRGLIRIQDEIERDGIHEYFSSLIKPGNRWTEYIKKDINYILERLIPFESFSGLISEFILFNTSKKKKDVSYKPKRSNLPRNESTIDDFTELRIGNDSSGIGFSELIDVRYPFLLAIIEEYKCSNEWEAKNMDRITKG